MKNNIIIACTIASLLLIIDTIHAGDMLMMFLFVGIIPGTNVALTPDQRLVLVSSITCFAIIRMVILPLARKLKIGKIKPSLTAKQLKRI